MPTSTSSIRRCVVSAAEGVLANDQDADGDRRFAELVTGPATGTLDLQPDGSFTYLVRGWVDDTGNVHLSGHGRP